MGSNTSHYYKIISKNIKELRISKRYSQEKFAELIGCSREYISRLENNKEKISLALLLHISCLFDVLPENLFKA